MKSGIWTTEFWTTLAVNVAALVVAIVALSGGSKADADHMGAAVRDGTIGLGALVVNLYTVGQYIRSRTQLKEQEADLKADIAKGS